MKIIIRLIAIAAKRVEICACLLCSCMAAVGQPPGKIGVCPVRSRHGKPQIFQ